MMYVVKSGDSPYKIAKKLGVSFASLIAANSQKPTTVIAGVRTFASLLPDEQIFVPVGSGNVKVTLEADTALDVEATASVAITTLNADQNYCVSVRHPGTPVNVAIHNFKKAWNASGQDIQLPINTGKYEPIVARALAVVMPNLPVPDGCDGTSPHRHRGVFIESRGVAGVGDTTGIDDSAWVGEGAGIGDGSATAVNSDNTITGGFNTVPEFPATPVVTMSPPPVVPDALTTLASTAAAALTADSNHCKSVGQPGSSVNTAVHAFKTAWNAANPSNRVPVGTGKYEASVATALTSLLGAGAAPDGCAGGGGGKHAPPPVPTPVAPPPPPAVVAALPPAPPAVVAATVVPPSPPAIPAPATGRHKPAPPPPVLPVAASLPPSPPAVSAIDTLTAVATAAATALNADAGHCMSVRHPGSAVNKAVHAFKKAWNEANPGNKVAMGTGKYEPAVAAALTSLLGAGMVPDGCEEHRHRPPPPLPPPAPVNVAAAPPPDPPPAPVAAAAPPDPPPAPAASSPAAAPLPDPPPAPHSKKEAGLIPSIDGISTGALIAGSIGAVALVGIVAAAASGKGKTIIHRYKKAPASAPAAKEKR